MSGSAVTGESALTQDGLATIVAEQRVYNRAVLAEAAGMPPPGVIAPRVLRERRLYRSDGSMRPVLAPGAFDRSIDTPFGAVATRIFPGRSAATIVHFHGGGWALGSIYEQDPLLADIADRCGAKVISIDYPLAPETQMPKALEIAVAALAAVITETSGPIAVMGESAGAHIALTCALRLRALPMATGRIAAMALNYGIYDLSMTPSQRRWGEPFLGLSTPWLEWFYSLTLPDHSRDQRSDPALSPLYADLANMPSTLFSVGTADPLLDDTLFLFQRWQSAGNVGELQIYPEAPHGFNHAPTAMAAWCNDRVTAFLGEALSRS